MDSDYLSISEFAKKSGVQRKALIYYDQIELLKPAKVTANGYRYYHYHQLYTINKILFLKEIGMSLKEIKQHITVKAPAETIDLLKTQKERAEQKRCYYQQMMEMLDLQLATLNEFACYQANTGIEIVEYDEPVSMYLHEKEFDINARERMSEALNNFYKDCIEAGFVFQYPPGVRIVLDADNNIEGGCYFIKIPDAAIKRPKGTYLQLYEKASDNLPQIYQRLFDYADQAGLKLCGAIYIDMIVNELVVPNYEDFILKFMVQVEEQEKISD